MSTNTFEYTTSNKQLATYLFKQGYTDYSFVTVDNNQCYRFVIPEALRKQLMSQKKTFLTK